MNAIQQALDCLKNGNRTWEAMEILEKAMTTNHDALREALELGLDYAREALALHDQKYQRHPSTEAERALIAGHVEQIEQTLAASKPEQAQGEPEVVATVSSRWSNGRGFDVDDFGKNLPNYGDELITLQSHREAIAKKDAALLACVDAMKEADEAMYSPRVQTQLVAKVHLDRAITQAQEARK